MAKDRSAKIPEQIRPEQPALENDPARKADRLRRAMPDRSNGFGGEHDPSPVTWFWD